MLNKGLNIFENNKDNLKLSPGELSQLKEYVNMFGGQLYPIP